MVNFLGADEAVDFVPWLPLKWFNNSSFWSFETTSFLSVTSIPASFNCNISFSLDNFNAVASLETVVVDIFNYSSDPSSSSLMSSSGMTSPALNQSSRA